MEKQSVFLIIWLLLLVVASIGLYPIAYKAFVKPSIIVYVIDTGTHKPVTYGSVQLHVTDPKSIYKGDVIDVKVLNSKGRVTFKNVPSKRLGVSYLALNGSTVEVDGIFPGIHDGKIDIYLYYYDQNIKLDVATANQPLTSDATVTNQGESSPDAGKFYSDEMPKYSVIFDDMRVRDKPSLDGNVLATLNTRDIVAYTGQESKDKSLITIEGDVLQTTWMKVITEKGVEGWFIKVALKKYKKSSY